MMNTFKKSILLASLVLILSCSQNSSEKIMGKNNAAWTNFRGNSQLTGISNESLPDDLTLLWSYQTEDDIKSSPVVAFGNVYIGSLDGHLYAIGLESGKLAWKFDTGDDIEAPPLIVDDKVLIGSLNERLYALDAKTGEKVWEYKTEGQISGSANWFVNSKTRQKNIIVGSYDNFIHCVTADSGKPLWKFQSQNYINGTPATNGEITIFGGCDAQLYMINVLDGTELGAVDTGSYIAGSATLYKDNAYLGHYGEMVLGIDLKNKETLWTFEDSKNSGPFFSTPAVNENYVVIGCRNQNVYCLNRETGEKVWAFQTRDEVDSSPVIAQEKVVVGSLDGRVYIIDLKTGQQLWSYEVGECISGSPAVVDGKIIIGAEDGRLYTFGKKE